MSIIPAHKQLKKDWYDLEANLGYTANLCLKAKQKKMLTKQKSNIITQQT